MPVLCALATALVAWVFLREEGLANPRLAVAAFWLNPIMLLHTPILGYVDSVFALLGFCSLILLYRRRFTGSIFFLALSCLTKPQGVLILPVVVATILVERDWRLFRRLTLLFILLCLAPLIPFALAGRALGALRGTLQVTDIGFLSWQQTNLWWIVSWLVPAIARHSLAALRNEVAMCRPQEFRALVSLDARLIAFVLLGVFVAFTLCFFWKELSRGNRLSIFWAAALSVYGFTMLSLYPHENHLYAFFVYSLPLLAFSRRVFLNLFVMLSALFGLNNYLFDGLGRGMTTAAHSLRNGLGFDLTVAVSLLYLAVFVWVLRTPRWYFGLTKATQASAVPPTASAPLRGPA